MAESTVGLDEGSTTSAGALTDGSGYKAIKHVVCYDNGSAVPVNTSATTPFPVVDTSTFGTVGTGSKDVTTAGTAVQLAADQACKEVRISINSDNAGSKIYYGGSSVSSTQGAFAYKADQIQSIKVSNLNLIYIDADTSGDGVTYTYFS